MRRRLASNVLWNWAGLGVTIATGFVLAPFLVHCLGDTTYGLWVLIASLAGYFNLLDLGVRGSVGRYIAFFRARDEQEEVNRTLSTAIVLLLVVAVLALVATLAVLLVFFHLFDVPPEEVPSVRLAILITGLNLALMFPVAVFDAVLWGYERFDLINIVDIPMAILRTVATFWLVHGPGDLVALAWITLIANGASEVAKLAASFYVEPRLRLSVGRFGREHARHLFGYGLWQFLLQISRQVGAQIGPLIIGSMLAVAAVTPFSFASRLIQYAMSFMVAATGVLTPLATALHARDDSEQERQLFIEGGKWCTAFALLAGIGLFLLGGPMLKLWLHSELAVSCLPILRVLIAGELMAMSQGLTYSILLGKARHRAMAIASLVEGILATVAGLLAARHWGMAGVCLVFAASALACRGIFQVVYACRVLGVGLWRYSMTAIAKPVLAAALPTGLLAMALQWREPGSWAELLGYCAAFTVLFAVTEFMLLGGMQYLPVRQGARWEVPRVEEVHG
jgi:O-antigen/teichoic acid export membrane protein